MTELLAEHFAVQMGWLLGPDFPTQIALAVSGGGDSMAMLALAHGWARTYGTGLHVVTVDHGLRAESAQEAAMVAKESAALGLPHTTLKWNWDGKGNLQDAARRARFSLIDGWRGDIDHVLFAHTQDDVAETFLMRLARGSGVEGLSAMAAKRRVRPSGFHIIRPLLETSRADLRHYVGTLKVPYVDDPSNDDPRFDRARARAVLRSLGIDAQTLANTAIRLSRASDALRARSADVARETIRTDAYGTVHIDRDGFAIVERDTQLRLLTAALSWVASAEYSPRAASLEDLLDRAISGGGGTLHGAEVRTEGDTLLVFRELNALRDASCDRDCGGRIWDRRWRVSGNGIEDLTLRALGPDGWTQLPKEARSGHNFRVAQTLPALFDRDLLKAFAPANFGLDHGLEVLSTGSTFATYLVSR